MNTLSFPSIKNKLKLEYFQEDGFQFIHSPLFKLTGYGHTVNEAEKSFIITFEEFLRYTEENKTLDKELVNLGIEKADFFRILKS